MNTEREITFEIVEKIGVIAKYQTGWTKEINLVSWNGSEPKYDIRDWSPDHERMSRGVTLREDELRLMLNHLKSWKRNEGFFLISQTKLLQLFI